MSPDDYNFSWFEMDDLLKKRTETTKKKFKQVRREVENIPCYHTSPADFKEKVLEILDKYIKEEK